MALAYRLSSHPFVTRLFWVGTGDGGGSRGLCFVRSFIADRETLSPAPLWKQICMMGRVELETVSRKMV